MIDGLATAKELWAKFDEKYGLISGSEKIELYLNGHNDIPSSKPDIDEALLKALQEGQWDSPLYEDENTHLSALQLFRDGKIHWSQKATISDVIETQRSFGFLLPCKILDNEGNFTFEAECFLYPFLFKGSDKVPLNPQELDMFKALIQTLPLSERFFFIYPDQRKDEKSSRPSPHNPIRDELTDSRYPFVRLLYGQDLRKDEKAKNIPEKLRLTYEAVLKLSYGAENALGLAGEGFAKWHALIPRLGEHDLEDVELAASFKARLTISGESRMLGLTDDLVKIHTVSVPYPDIHAHDDFHRKALSMLPPNVNLALDRIINNAREMFGFRWSADIWLIRDASSFGIMDEKAKSKIASAKSEVERTTRLLDNFLHSVYIDYTIRKCPTALQKKFKDSLILFDVNLSPKQIACYFIVDLVLNPSSWLKLDISDNEKYYSQPYKELIKCAKFMKERGTFSSNMKSNILKFECVAKSTRNDSEKPNAGAEQLKEIDQHLDEYLSQRNNKLLFLGFAKNKVGKFVEPEDSLARTKITVKPGK